MYPRPKGARLYSSPNTLFFVNSMININDIADYALDFAKTPNIIANAIITFASSSGEVVTFDDIGRPIVTATSIETTLTAYLRQTPSDRFTNNQKNVVGTDVLSNYYIGRLVEPKNYTFPIRADGEIKIVLDGRKGRLIELFTVETASSIDAGLPSNLGQRIQCNIEFFEGN